MLMISDSSTTLLDEIFKVGSAPMKAQLMKVFCEFLAAEETRIEKRAACKAIIRLNILSEVG